ncbi:hypothetical protein ACFW2D_29710 [Streptomyces sp. NPDC058914]|uniref:hypothetical protein n=1 Tax=Streptomyces sp. NPDC058914 TaxID=3346671 RepID=UPI0036765FEF
MGRVEWTRLSGDDVEEVVAILVSREHPRVERIRPSRGDGGIDILLPVGDGTFRVFQVKKFTENLDSSQKRQIKKSFNRLVEYLRGRDMSVSNWSLVTPLDRTKENLAWLSTVTEGVSFETDWLGLPYVEGLVSQYPEVIDYYLKDGKERLQVAISDLMKSLNLHAGLRDSSTGYQPADSFSSLHALHAEMNRYDPHYRYDFSVDSDSAEVAQPDVPGLVCAVQQSDGRSRVTVRVIARFADAVHVRPIPLSVRVRAQSGSELETALEEFGSFGTPITIPQGNVEVTLDLPGGLGISDAASELSFLMPRPSATPQELQFSILDPASVVLAETEMLMHTGTRGRAGADFYGTEEGGVFDLTLRLVFPNQLTRISVHPKDFAGRKLETVLPGVRFLANLRSPNALRIVDPYTGSQAALATLGMGTVGDPELICKCVEALMALQAVAGRRIPTPDFSAVSVGDALDWLRAARLVRGEVVDVTWNDIEVSVKSGHEDDLKAQFPGALLLRYPLTIRVSETDYDLGLCQFWTPAAQIRQRNGSLVIENGKAFVEPMDGAHGVLRKISPLEIPHEN